MKFLGTEVNIRFKRLIELIFNVVGADCSTFQLLKKCSINEKTKIEIKLITLLNREGHSSVRNGCVPVP